jgi:hypothetical protein
LAIAAMVPDSASIYHDGWKDLNKNIEPGEFQVWISKDSSSGEPAEFELEK